MYAFPGIDTRCMHSLVYVHFKYMSKGIRTLLDEGTLQLSWARLEREP